MGMKRPTAQERSLSLKNLQVTISCRTLIREQVHGGVPGCLKIAHCFLTPSAGQEPLPGVGEPSQYRLIDWYLLILWILLVALY